ncbi:putative DNA-binding domain-containing protein [Undibacterium sp. RuRC25W]|uniref:HvfC/BufC family peptide modification chaperone n=1 Tax=Undibacterium sp. RuRC25W TaxID=3413047 RepID=UPI003BEFD604
MKLAQIQQSFSEALLDPTAFGSLSQELSTHSRLQERFAYYRGNQNGIWNAALSGAYPVLLQLVGVDFFMEIAKAYGIAHPSQSGDLNLFGAHLATFLQGSDFIDAYPYFTDVARLEWQLHRTYYAADAPHLSLREALFAAETSGRDLATAYLVVHPATSLFRSQASAIDIWQAHQGHGDVVFPVDLLKENLGSITRPQWHASLTQLTHADYLGLQALFERKSLGDALELVLCDDATFDIGLGLQRWFSSETFTQIVFSK